MKKQISILIISLLIQSQISAQWVNTNNLTNEVVTFAVMPDGMGGTKLFAGSYSGVYLSTDYGKNWISVNKGLTDKSIEALAAIGYYVFAATSSGIFRSTDSGLNWTAANNGLSYPDISSFAVWNTNIYAGGTGSDVYLSTNYGASWSRIGYIPRQNYVSSLAVSSVSPGNIEIFAANYSNGIYRSTDKGLNWNPANSGLSTSNAKYIKVLTSYVNASGSTTLFAGTTGDGVFRSTNSGIDWYQVPSGLTYGGLNVTSFVMSGTNLFAGTYDGVFLSTNNGKSWTSVNTGLPASTMVKSLTLCGRYLVAGTYNGDIWRRPLTEMIVPSQWIQTNGPYGSILPNGNYGGDVTSFLITAGATGGTNIFAGTSGNGIFLTTDDGINWNKTSDLPNSNIQNWPA